MLSSEEEEEEDEKDPGRLHVQALEGAKDLHRQQKPVQSLDRHKFAEKGIHPSDMSSQVSITEIQSRGAA